MAEIVPAILARGDEELKAQARALPAEVQLFHLDVLEEDVWTPIDKAFEVHLMVVDPHLIADRWIARGAKRVIAHKLDDFKEKSIPLGLAIEMHIPLDNIQGEIKKADFVHLMSIDEIGEQGHPLNPEIFDRIKEVRSKFPSLPISVDGGINLSNIENLIEAGADRLVIGTAFKEVWSEMKK